MIPQSWNDETVVLQEEKDKNLANDMSEIKEGLKKKKSLECGNNFVNLAISKYFNFNI